MPFVLKLFIHTYDPMSVFRVSNTYILQEIGFLSSIFFVKGRVTLAYFDCDRLHLVLSVKCLNYNTEATLAQALNQFISFVQDLISAHHRIALLK